MKSNELRIGNYVFFGQFKGSIGIVSEITYATVTIKGLISAGPRVRLTGILLGNKYDYYKPIPLTKEWLKKFGFENSVVDIRLDDFYIKRIRGTANYEYFCNNSVVLKHVHQLQNLYFALTGKELEIK